MAPCVLVSHSAGFRTSRIVIFKFCRILVLLEWISGYGLGRPCSIHDEE